MRRTGRVAVAGFLWMIAGAADAEPRSWTATVGAARDTVDVSPGQVRVCVSRQPVWVGTFAVREGDRTYELGVDYTTDPDAGCVELLRASADERRLVIDYRYVPVTVPPRRWLHRPVELGPDDRPAPATSPEPTPVDPAARLVVGGSKTFSVEVGSNRDAVLKQSLDLTLNGEIARDVTVRAVLSDRDSPFTPQGTSAELDELDDVLIQLEAPNTQATFGDVTARRAIGEFARFERQLEGVTAARTGARVRVSGAVGNSRGEYRTVDFFGVEGSQGPYDLASRVGSSGVGIAGIVPGSESVTVDGVGLQRGQDRDYTIDYDLAELTFTPRRPITFDSRITVEFEEATDDYRRRLAAADADVEVLDDIRIRASIVSESDDRDDPRGFSLSDDERDILADVGDGEPIGEAFAIREVGAGNGDYSRATDGINEFVEYRGPGGGDLLVSFVRVGTDLGAYADSTGADGTLFYRFVGPGQGNFDFGRRLGRPEAHNLASVAVDVSRPDLRVEAELAASDLDANTFSPLQDSDNDGVAGSGRIEWTGVGWNDGRGGVTVRGRWRHLSDDFRAINRLTPSFDALNWNYTPGQLDAGETRSGLDVDVRPGDGSTLRLEGGRLENDEFHGDRVGAAWSRSGRAHVDASWRRTWTSEVDSARGRRDVHAIEAGLRMGAFHPVARYRSEETRDSGDASFGGSRFQSVGGELRTQLSGALVVRVDGSRRLDQTRIRRTGDEWARRTLTWDRGAALTLTRWRGADAELELRRRDVEPSEAGDAALGTTTDLARLAVQLAPRRQDVRIRLDAQVTTESVVPRTKTVIFVGEGLGTHDSLGVFVGTGDYTVDIDVGSDPERLSRLDVSFRGDARTGDASARPWQRWQGSSFVRVRSLTRARFSEVVNPFDGGLYDDGPSAVDGSLSMRHEASMAPRARVTPRVRWEAIRRVDGRFDTVRELREEDTVALDVRASLSERWTARVEGARETDGDTVVRSADGVRVEDRFESLRAEAGATFKPTAAWSIGTDVSREWVDTDDAPTTERRTEVRPVVAYAPPRWGRVELRGRRVWVSDPLPRRRPAFEFGLDTRSGIEWSILSDYRLRDYLTLGGTFRSVRPDDESTRFDGRIELRAFF